VIDERAGAWARQPATNESPAGWRRHAVPMPLHPATRRTSSPARGRASAPRRLAEMIDDRDVGGSSRSGSRLAGDVHRVGPGACHPAGTQSRARVDAGASSSRKPDCRPVLAPLVHPARRRDIASTSRPCASSHRRSSCRGVGAGGASLASARRETRYDSETAVPFRRRPVTPWL